jgi:hypothetical protein
VAGQRQRAAAEAGDLVGGRVEVGLLAGGEHDVGAGPGQPQRDGADAPTRAGHDRDAVIQTEVGQLHGRPPIGECPLFQRAGRALSTTSRREAG